MESSTISAPILHYLLEGAIAQGYDTDHLLQSNGVSPALIREPLARVTFEQWSRVSLAVMTLLDDEAYGLLYKPRPRNSFKHTGIAMMHGRTVGESLHNAFELFDLIGDDLGQRLHVESDTVRYELTRDYREVCLNCHGLEHLLISLHRTLCWLANAEIPIRRVHLQFPPPFYATEYRHFFYGAPALFEQTSTALVLDRAVMESPNVRSKDELTRFLQRSPLSLVSQTVSLSSLSSRIRTWIERQFRLQVSRVTIEQASSEFEMHPQALRRSLRKESTTFEQLKIQTRRDLSITLLTQSKDSIETIAARVGYSEASAFIRAFREWTSMTPRHYRAISSGS